MSVLLPAALRMRAAGLSIIPTHPTEKRPLVPWEIFQHDQATEADLRTWFEFNNRSMGLVCGKVSGNLELLDFDNAGELFEPWKDLVEDAAFGLVDRLVIERSQRGGIHVVYRCPACTIPGNLKLAAVAVDGKRQTRIETRGEGGQFLCAPSKGYELLQGDFEHLPKLTPDERGVLIDCARALNTWIEPARNVAPGRPGGDRPGDRYNESGDVQGVLEAHGWQSLGVKGENEYWRRPGKNKGACSATLHPVKGLYVFSSNAHPFEPDTCYSRFAVKTLLDHAGDYRAAASAVARAEAQAAPPLALKTPPRERDVKDPLDLDGTEHSHRMHIDALLDYDIANDPNNLLGNRWVCRGGSVLIVAQSGAGKSTFITSAAATWAQGKPFLGIRPMLAGKDRPLRSVIVQSENDMGDEAQMLQGIQAVLGISRGDLKERVHIFRNRVLSGPEFIRDAERLIERHKPDLFWFDPLTSYMGGDLTRAVDCAMFFRKHLDALLEATGVAAMVVHHTPKPPKAKDQNAWKGGDFAYFGAGSADITNWARSIVTLHEAEEHLGIFELKFPKRGDKAGVMKPRAYGDFEPVLEPAPGRKPTVFIQHSPAGQVWDYATKAPDLDEGYPRRIRGRPPTKQMEFLRANQTAKVEKGHDVAEAFKAAQGAGLSMAYGTYKGYFHRWIAGEIGQPSTP